MPVFWNRYGTILNALHMHTYLLGPGKHDLIKGTNKMPKRKSKSKNKEHVCLHCGKVYRKFGEMARHARQVHHPSFQCTVCKKMLGCDLSSLPAFNFLIRKL